MKSTRRFLASALRTGLVFAITFVSLDLFLQASGTSVPSFVVDNDSFGRLLRPNADLVFVNEGFTIGRVNESGYLGPNRPQERTAGARRVALIGDSFVEGFQLFDRHHFRNLLEESLSDDLEAPVEVLNFGFSGFNFRRMFHYTRDFVLDYEPDVLVVVVGADDFLEPERDLGPRFKVSGDELDVDLSFRESASFRRKIAVAWTRAFGHYSLAKKSFRLAKDGEAPRILLEKLHPGHDRPGETAPFSEEAAPGETGRVNEIMLDELAGWSQSGDVRVIFVAKRDLGDHYTRAIRRRGLLLLDPAVAFDTLRDQGIDPNAWAATSQIGHWNHEGHRVLAGFLAPRLAGELRALK